MEEKIFGKIIKKIGWYWTIFSPIIVGTTATIIEKNIIIKTIFLIITIYFIAILLIAEQKKML